MKKHFLFVVLVGLLVSGCATGGSQMASRDTIPVLPMAQASQAAVPATAQAQPEMIVGRFRMADAEHFQRTGQLPASSAPIQAATPAVAVQTAQAPAQARPAAPANASAAPANDRLTRLEKRVDDHDVLLSAHQKVINEHTASIANLRYYQAKIDERLAGLRIDPSGRGQTIRIGTYRAGSAELTPEIMVQLDSAFDRLNELGKAEAAKGNRLAVEIEGLASGSGSTARNQELSELRAKAVADYLSAKAAAGELKFRVSETYGSGVADVHVVDYRNQCVLLRPRVE